MPTPMNDRTNRTLIIGAATNWAAFAAALAVTFFLAPYLIRNLGDARYGVWCVVESILAYFTLFDLGVAACLVRFVAKYHATGERAELNRVVSACLAVFSAAALCVLVLGSALVPRLALRCLPWLRLSVGVIDRATLRQVKGYSVDAFLAMFAGRVTVQTGAIVVGGFLGVVAAAHYSIAVRLVEAAKNLLRAVTATLAPAV